MSRPRRARKSVPGPTRRECSATAEISMLSRSATGGARAPQAGGRRSSSACKLIVAIASLHLFLILNGVYYWTMSRSMLVARSREGPGLFCYTGDRFWATEITLRMTGRRDWWWGLRWPINRRHPVWGTGIATINRPLQGFRRLDGISQVIY